MDQFGGVSEAAGGRGLREVIPSVGSWPLVGLPERRVEDFWSWAYSDFLSNTNRPLLAEFAVGVALGAANSPRREWDSVDFRYCGHTIEVKSAGFVQSWQQKGPSIIRFSMGPQKAPWDSVTNLVGRPGRTADCYVFCLHLDKAREGADALDMARWEFYVIATSELNRRFPTQKSIGLANLRRLTVPIPYNHVRGAVDEALGLNPKE